MHCKKCGYELKDGWNICPKCSSPIASNNGNIQPSEVTRTDGKQEIIDYSGKDKTYLIVFLTSIALGGLIERLRIICFLIALIMIVTAFIKYPKSRAVKVLFWLFLAGIALGIIFILIVASACISAMPGYSCR